MEPLPIKPELNKKLILAIGILGVILLIGAAYFFLNSSGDNASGQNYPQGESPQTTESDYASASIASQQRNEGLFSEGDTKTFRGQTIEVVKISQESVLVKAGSETKIIGSGKDASFGSVSVKVMSISYSGEAQYRKAIIRIGDSAASQETLGSQTREFTLSEGESAKEDSFGFTVASIGRDSVSISFGQEGRTIFNDQWERIGNFRVEIKSIFYTGDAAESKAVIVVTKLGN